MKATRGTGFFLLGTRLGTLLFCALTVLSAHLAPLDAQVADARSKPISEAITGPARALSRAFEAAASQVTPGVVSVYSEKTIKMGNELFPFPFGSDLFRQFFGRDFDQQRQPSQPQQRGYVQHGMGSGMILDPQGNILTNYHVIKDVDQIKVQLSDKRQFPAEVVGTDPKSDVAVIRIKGKAPANLPVVQLGDSSALKVGDWVLAVGAPFGLTQTVTAGIISATGRADVGITDYEDFLQTDAAINPGNSGGPLVNIDGEVIGMNTAIATGLGQFAGVGFAIPSNMIRSYLPTLIKGGAIIRGYLGVAIQDLSDELARQFKAPNTKGALISQVNKDTPADKAGLKPGDIVTSFQGKPVENSRELRQQVASTPPETKVNLTILRDGKEQALPVTLGKLPAQGGSNPSPGGEPGSLDNFGLSVEPLTPELAKQLGYQGQKGVVIGNVEPGSLAAMANLQAGDLIVEANRQPVESVEDLRNALANSKETVLLLIRRKEATLYVTMRVG